MHDHFDGGNTPRSLRDLVCAATYFDDDLDHSIETSGAKRIS
jgi:hypothetical protein